MASKIDVFVINIQSKPEQLFKLKRDVKTNKPNVLDCMLDTIEMGFA